MKPYPEYKDSSTKWMPSIPSHWEVKRLKHLLLKDGLVRGPFGSTLKTEFFVEQGYKVYEQKNAIYDDNSLGNSYINAEKFRELKRFSVKEGDFIMSCSGTIGRISWIKEGFQVGVINQALLIMRLNERIAKSFFEYLFRSSGVQYNISDNSQGSAMKNLVGMDIFKNISLPIPPLSEQQTIADFLNCKTAQIDTLIEKKQQQIDLLQEQRTALINQAVTKGLNLNAPMKDSGVEWLREIPRHWEVMKIAYFVDKITNGYVGPTRDILRDDGVRYIQSLHIKRNTIDFHKPYYVSHEWSHEHERTILRENDVLVVQTGAIGEVGVVPKEFDGANCHALIILRAKENLGNGKFLLYALTSNYGYHSMLSIMTGALHPHLNTTYLRDVYLAIPPKTEQQEIIEYIENKIHEIDLTIKKQKDAVSLLQEYRTALISEAVTGKIDVREWKTVHE